MVDRKRAASGRCERHLIGAILRGHVAIGGEDLATGAAKDAPESSLGKLASGIVGQPLGEAWPNLAVLWVREIASVARCIPTAIDLAKA